METSTNACPSCGLENPNTNDFCRACGEYLRWEPDTAGPTPLSPDEEEWAAGELARATAAARVPAERPAPAIVPPPATVTPARRGTRPSRRSGIFVCYRREDSRWPAGRLADALAERFGKDDVFIDVDSLHVGKWREQVNAALSACSIVVVVIGPSWAEEFSRRSDGRDEVRYEICEAIRQGRTLLPVTIGRARVPEPHEIPADLAPVLDGETYELLEDRLWEPTLAVLLDDLARALAGSGSPGAR